MQINPNYLIKNCTVYHKYKRIKNALAKCKSTYEFMVRMGYDPLTDEQYRDVEDKIVQYYEQ